MKIHSIRHTVPGSGQACARGPGRIRGRGRGTAWPVFRMTICGALAAWAGAVEPGQAALVKVEAESAMLGADYAVGNDGGVQYIEITSNTSGPHPVSSNRVAAFSVTFPEAGTYSLFARVWVGAGGASDDSFFYGNGFGAKNPADSGDWITVNALSVAGYADSWFSVTGNGTSGIEVWKWVNLTEFTNGGETPIAFPVTAGTLTQTFQIGAREGGLRVDALVFGNAVSVYSVAQLDTGGPGPPPTAGTCTVFWDDLRQQIDGFGASSAWRSGWTAAQADMFFSTNSGVAQAQDGSSFPFTGIGLSLLRNRITPSGTTIETSIMQMAQDRGALVWSSPWSPPVSLKDSGTVNGGHFVSSAANYQAYAVQLADYVQDMTTAGINLYAISIQNEPNLSTSYESCEWTGQQIHDFVPYLRAALDNNGAAATKILLPEPFNWDFTLTAETLGDVTTRDMIDILAFHDYGTPGDSGPRRGKAVWQTEDSFLEGSDSSISNGVYWAHEIHEFMTTLRANAWHYWWLISANGTGNEGLADANWVPAKRMYTVGNFSRFVRPGDVRIDVTQTGDALVSAYRNPTNGAFAIVAVNPTTVPINQTFDLNGCTAGAVTPWVTSGALSLANQTPVGVGGTAFASTIPALSVVTYVGTGSGAAVTNAPLFTTIATAETPAGMHVEFTVDGDTGPDYTVLTSSNLITWQVLFTTNAPTLPVLLTDTNAAAGPVRYYRVAPGP